MPRIARAVAVGLPHHITQRGNNQQEVFLEDCDYETYFSILSDYSTKYDLSVLADTLMPTHVHFVAIPGNEVSLAKTFRDAHTLYAKYFNKKMGRTGHLWQSRFYSCVMDEPHLIAAARYIEQNPVRANLVNKPWRWKWSSASIHADEGSSLIQLEDLFKYIEIPQSEWKRFITHPEEARVMEKVRKHTLTGRPLGNEAFVERIEKKTGRRLVIQPNRRPTMD